MIETQTNPEQNNIIQLPVARAEQTPVAHASPEVMAHQRAVDEAKNLVAQSYDPTGPESQRILANARQVQRDMSRHPVS